MNKLKGLHINIGERLIKIMLICFSIFFGIILVNTIFYNRTTQVNYKVPMMLILPIILYGIVYILYKKVKVKFLYKSPKKYQIALVMAVLFVLQIIFAILTYADCGWDCGIVIREGLNLMNGGDFDSHYFSVCPNNIGTLIIVKYVLMFASIFCEITWEASTFIMIVFNIIMVDIAAILTFLMCKKIRGNRSAYFSLLFILPLIIFSPYIIIPYTDTISMVFPIGVLYIYMVIKEEKECTLKKKLLIILEGILTIIGWYIKPTAIIMVIAILIVEILRLEQVKAKKVAIVGIMFLIGCGISYSGYSYLKDKSLGALISEEDYDRYTMSFTHFLKMGMQQKDIETELPTKNKTLYGGYSEDDVLSTQSKIGKEEKQNENINVVKQRLKNFGVVGYTKFLYNKANWILSDGTFFFGEEGHFWTSEHYNQSEIGKFFQKLINNKSDEYQNVTANIMQTVWILVTIGLVLSYTSKEQNDYIIISKLSIIGIVVFLLLFEARARYIVNHLPIFIIVGVFGIRNSFRIIQKSKNKKPLLGKGKFTIDIIFKIT